MIRAEIRAALLSAPVLWAALGCTTPGGIPPQATSASAQAPAVSNAHLMAVARTFERQGRLDKAKQLYHRVEQSDPANTEAGERLQVIAAYEREHGQAPQTGAAALASRDPQPKRSGVIKPGTPLPDAQLAQAHPAKTQPKAQPKSLASDEPSFLPPPPSPEVASKSRSHQPLATVTAAPATSKPASLTASETEDRDASFRAVAATPSSLSQSEKMASKSIPLDHLKAVATNASAEAPKWQMPVVVPDQGFASSAAVAARGKAPLLPETTNTAAPQPATTPDPFAETPISIEPASEGESASIAKTDSGSSGEPAVASIEFPSAGDEPAGLLAASSAQHAGIVEEVSAPRATPEELSAHEETISTARHQSPSTKLTAETLAAIRTARPLDKSDLVARLSPGELIELLKDGDAENRSLAAYSLGYCAAEAPECQAALRLTLATERVDFVRIRLAEAIARFAPDDEAVDLLVGYLSDADSELRWLAASVLTVGGHEHPNVIDGLTQAVQDRDPKVAAMAALTLAQYGPAAKSAIPTLRDATRAADAELREAARAALACVQPRSVSQASGESAP